MKLGDIAREVKENEKNPLEAGLDRIVGLEHLDPEELKISRWGNVTDGTTFTRKFRAGQILFGRRRAYQKKAALADFDGICSGDITVIEAIPGKVVPELLPYIIQNDAFFEYAVNESAGSLSPRVKWKHLAEYEINLPDTDTQRKIAELMIAFDESIEEKKTIIHSLEAIKTNLLLPKNKVGVRMPFSKVFELRRELIETTDENVKYIALEHIEPQTGKILYSGKASDAVSIKSKFYESDILFGKLRVYLRKYWLATYEGVCSTEILVLKCRDVCIPEYGFYIVQNEDFINFAINNSFGTKMPRTSWERLSEYEIYLPDKNVQVDIVTRLKEIDNIIQGLRDSITALLTMKKVHLQKSVQTPNFRVYSLILLFT